LLVVIAIIALLLSILMPALRRVKEAGKRNVFSFVDGHSEFHDWKDQRTIDLAELCYEDRSPEARNRPGNAPGDQADNEDLIWAARAQWGTIKK
jgi:hypothetical protein